MPAILKGSGNLYLVQHFSTVSIALGSEILWPGVTNTGLLLACVLSTAPNWLNLPEKRTKLPLRAGGILKSLKIGLFEQAMVAKSSQTPKWEAKPNPLGWTTPRPGKIARSGLSICSNRLKMTGPAEKAR